MLKILVWVGNSGNVKAKPSQKRNTFMTTEGGLFPDLPRRACGKRHTRATRQMYTTLLQPPQVTLVLEASLADSFCVFITRETLSSALSVLPVPTTQQAAAIKPQRDSSTATPHGVHSPLFSNQAQAEEISRSPALPHPNTRCPSLQTGVAGHREHPRTTSTTATAAPTGSPSAQLYSNKQNQQKPHRKGFQAAPTHIQTNTCFKPDTATKISPSCNCKRTS